LFWSFNSDDSTFNTHSISTETLIAYGGVFIVCLVVFCNTGLFFCFFVPSGAVLFSTGVLLAAGKLPYNSVTVLLLLVISSIAGSICGYLLGRYIGPMLYSRKESFFFKQKHLRAAETFYQKYGGWALTAGYFLPIIRSFSPSVAGISRIKKDKLIIGITAGSLSWVVSFTGSGYFLGSRPLLKPWLTYIVVGFICVVTVPLVIKIIRSFRSGK
jgi:membrane-associated protein